MSLNDKEDMRTALWPGGEGLCCETEGQLEDACRISRIPIEVSTQSFIRV